MANPGCPADDGVVRWLVQGLLMRLNTSPWARFPLVPLKRQTRQQRHTIMSEQVPQVLIVTKRRQRNPGPMHSEHPTCRLLYSASAIDNPTKLKQMHLTGSICRSTSVDHFDFHPPPSSPLPPLSTPTHSRWQGGSGGSVEPLHPVSSLCPSARFPPFCPPGPPVVPEQPLKTRVLCQRPLFPSF